MTTLNRSRQADNLSITSRIWLFSSRNWIFLFAVFFGAFVWLPFGAPLFMKLGWESLGKAVYGIYFFFCHQLPQRSYFLFGPQISYSIPEIQAAWKDTLDPIVLRQFTGSPDLGWKVAWSDRMVSMYLSTWMFGILWWPLRKRVKPLPWWGLVLLLLPMAVDGTTHLISDLFGLGQGFRDNNAWLAGLTGNRLPTAFYTGDAWGSFNAWMRLITGVIFGLGIVWVGFPCLEMSFRQTAAALQARAKQFASNDSS